MRVTQLDVQAAFARAFPPEKRASDVGEGPADGYDNRHNIGKLALDYQPTYGGWVVIAYVDGTSGMGSAQSNPFGSQRRSSREMVAFLEGVAAGRSVVDR